MALFLPYALSLNPVPRDVLINWIIVLLSLQVVHSLSSHSRSFCSPISSILMQSSRSSAFKLSLTILPPCTIVFVEAWAVLKNIAIDTPQHRTKHFRLSISRVMCGMKILDILLNETPLKTNSENIFIRVFGYSFPQLWNHFSTVTKTVLRWKLWLGHSAINPISVMNIIGLHLEIQYNYYDGASTKFLLGSAPL